MESAFASSSGSSMPRMFLFSAHQELQRISCRTFQYVSALYRPNIFLSWPLLFRHHCFRYSGSPSRGKPLFFIASLIFSMFVSSKIMVSGAFIGSSSAKVIPGTDLAASLAVMADDAQVMPGTFTLIFRSAADAPAAKTKTATAVTSSDISIVLVRIICYPTDFSFILSEDLIFRKTAAVRVHRP